MVSWIIAGADQLISLAEKIQRVAGTVVVLGDFVCSGIVFGSYCDRLTRVAASNRPPKRDSATKAMRRICRHCARDYVENSAYSQFAIGTDGEVEAASRNCPRKRTWLEQHRKRQFSQHRVMAKWPARGHRAVTTSNDRPH